MKYKGREFSVLPGDNGHCLMHVKHCADALRDMKNRTAASDSAMPQKHRELGKQIKTAAPVLKLVLKFQILSTQFYNFGRIAFADARH
ncbi:hypothetical protein SDC9_66589 [bioreactor metagenome]|uniref:Uncharacterized protein n=1 Tax=bioreactor metagenome TaxID=1076179 RepID=A0A644XVC1_9ZZZZ